MPDPPGVASQAIVKSHRHHPPTVVGYGLRRFVRELYHVLYWTGRTYLRKGAESLQGKTFDESLVPNVEPAPAPASVQALEALKAQRDAAAEARKEIESELEAVRGRLAAIKAENEGVHETHDWNEDKTRTLIIDLDLERAGWPLDREQDREYEVTGMPNESGIGYADYVLWGDDGKPLAVVEAKKTTVDPAVGQQQAKLYADCLETMHGQRPIIFYTNGYETRLWDDLAYPPRPVAGFYKKDELASLIIRRAQRAPLDVSQVKDDIVERYYQKRAIGSIGEQFAQTRRKALLVMATSHLASGRVAPRTKVPLRSLVERGLDVSQGVLVILDSGKGLRSAVRKAFRNRALVQRCQGPASAPARSRCPFRRKPRKRFSPDIVMPSAMTIVASANVLPSRTMATTSSPARSRSWSSRSFAALASMKPRDTVDPDSPMAPGIASAAASSLRHEIPYRTRVSNRSFTAPSPCRAAYDRSGISLPATRRSRGTRIGTRCPARPTGPGLLP